MSNSKRRIFSRNNQREWIPLTKHRAGWNSDPNLINIANGYITGLDGYPELTIKHVTSDGTEIYRGNGAYEITQAYNEDDEILVRAANLAEVRTFYVRYNQVKSLSFNLSDLVNVKAIGLRNNGISGLGHVDLSNCHSLVNLDLSGNSSVTELTVSSQAPIDFYYLGGTSVTTSTIDYVLQMAVDSGVVNGQMGYDPEPSPSSQDNYDTLINRGWQLGPAPSSVVGVNHSISSPIALSTSLQAPSILTPQVVHASVSAGVQDISIAVNAATASSANNKPLKPTGLKKTTSASTELSVAWDSQSDADTYELEVYRYDEANGWTYDLQKTATGITGTAHTFTGLLDTVMYEVRLYARNVNGLSPEYMKIWTAAGPLLAAEITLTDVGADYISFDYAGGTGGDTYELYHTDPQGNHNLLETFTAPNGESGSYTHSGLSSGGNGYYFVALKETAEHYGEGNGAYLGTKYISPTGDDANDGETQQTAWRTIGRVNQDLETEKGATYAFEGGNTYLGQINAKQSWVGFTSYGTGQAVIDAGLYTGIKGTNVHDITIDNLEIKGDGPTTNTENGIHLINDLANNEKLLNITITNVSVHGFWNSGIFIEGANVSAGFQNVLIDNATVYECAYAGILSEGVFDTNKTTYAHHDFTVQNSSCYYIRGDANKTDGHSGNGIVLSDVQNGLITNCIAHDCAENNNWTGGGAVGIWFWDSDQVTIEHCEAYNISGGLTGKDGGGFDLDGGVTNGKIQYCYAHDCDGGGLMIGQFELARAMDNNIIRYNICENTALTNNGQIFVFSGETNMGISYIFNNTVITDNSTIDPFAEVVWNSGSVGDVRLHNNILLGDMPTLSASITASNNWKDADGDPLFVDSATRPSGLQLQDTSPLIDAGIAVSGVSMGTEDYFGNSVNLGSGYDIGGAENQNATSVNVTISAGVQQASITLNSVSVTAVDNSTSGVTSFADVTGKQLWLDGTDSGTMTLDGSNNVNQWNNKVSGGVNYDDSVGPSPVFTNGVIKFQGSRMDGSSTIPEITATADHSGTIIFEMHDFSNQDLFNHTNSSSDRTGLGIENGTLVFGMYNGSSYIKSGEQYFGATGKVNLSWEYVSEVLTVWVNGVQVTHELHDPPVNFSSTNRFEGLNVDYHEIMVKQGAFTTEEREYCINKGFSYDASYQAVLDYAETNSITLPRSDQRQKDNEFLIDYKATGAWDRDDFLYKFDGTADAAFKLICWKRLAQATAYGSLTWSSTGVKGNGANAYIDPNYVGSNGTNWTLQNAGISYRSSQIQTGTGAACIFGMYEGSNTDKYHIVSPASGHIGLNSYYTQAGSYLTDLLTTIQQEPSASSMQFKTGLKLSGSLGVAEAPQAHSLSAFILARNKDSVADLYSDAELAFISGGADRMDLHDTMRPVIELEFETETADYMNAMSVPNDGTATIYSKTGTEIWNLFDDCVKFAKSHGEWGWWDIHAFYPMYGDTATTLVIEAKAATSMRTFYGSWVFDATGLQGNGSNTYLDRGITASDLGTVDLGITIGVASNVADSGTVVDIGGRGTGDGRFFLGRNSGNFFGRVGDTNAGIDVSQSTAAGINQIVRHSGTLRGLKNGTEIQSVTASGTVLNNTPIYYGAYANQTSPALYSSQKLLSEVVHGGHEKTTDVVREMIDMWEAGLGRKTWT